jgi:hypothetical protein
MDLFQMTNLMTRQIIHRRNPLNRNPLNRNPLNRNLLNRNLLNRNLLNRNLLSRNPPNRNPPNRNRLNRNPLNRNRLNSNRLLHLIPRLIFLVEVYPRIYNQKLRILQVLQLIITHGLKQGICFATKL